MTRGTMLLPETPPPEMAGLREEAPTVRARSANAGAASQAILPLSPPYVSPDVTARGGGASPACEAAEEGTISGGTPSAHP
mmetsp:Transcript_10269/g.30449  ORF Transcript_10269/g.30449 Transcript_10269/m.30449 type:complete len:81 (-) Transcript_10269:429-671(-)